MRKDDSKPSGLRAFFSRRRRKSSTPKEESAPDTPKNKSSETLPSDGASTTTARRKFVPRHAARDMVLSMPADQRPDLVAKAKEEQRKNVCSEIGFNTSLPSSNVSIRSGSSKARSVNILSMHPNLQMTRNVTTQRLMGPQSSSASIKSASSSVRPPLLRPISTPTKLHQMSNMSDLDRIPPSPDHLRPPAMHTMTEPAIPGQAESNRLQKVLEDLGLDREDSGSTGSDHTRSSIPAEDRNTTVSLPRPPRQYFSHNNSLPNLRANSGGKGKERAVDSVRNVSYNSSAGNSASSYESREAYVIQTQVRKSTNGLAPPAPASYGSRGSSVAGSTDSRFNADLSFVNESSTRAGSLSTAITEHTEYEEEQEYLEAAVEAAEAKPSKEEDALDKLKEGGFGDQDISISIGVDGTGVAAG